MSFAGEKWTVVKEVTYYFFDIRITSTNQIKLILNNGLSSDLAQLN